MECTQVFGSGSPFFQGHVPLPRAVTADSSSPASDAPLYAPTSSGPPPWDEARAGAGEGEGRTHRSRGCCSPARAPARPPRCQPGSSQPRSQLLGSSPRLPPPPSNPKVKIAVSAVCTSLNAGCTVPPSARPPEGPRRLRLRSPRPQTLCPPESRTSGFAVEQGETQSWPQEVSGL